MTIRHRPRPCAWPLLALGLLAVAGASASGMTPQFQQAVHASQPVLYYQLNESTGNAVNFGSAGNSLDATYVGTPGRGTATRAGDDGVTFTGANDYLESLGVAPAQFTGNPTMSLETVVYLPAGGTAVLWPPFLHWGAGGTGKESYFSLQNNNVNRIYAGFYNAGLRTVQTVPLDTWLHVVWVRQGGGDSQTGTALFINGQSVALEVDTDLCCNPLTPNLNATTFRVNRGVDFTRYFTGTMDELALYDRALSLNEIATHYRAFLRLSGDLNCDGDVGFGDINPFILALSNPPGYQQQFPDCDIRNGDVNEDGKVDFGDINPFIKLLTGP